MRADRLVSILLLLQNQGKLTTRQLAEKLEVAERTILRDMEALSIAGIPVYAERGNKGGWRLTAGYRTTVTGMKAEELTSLLISAHPGVQRDLGIEQHFDRAFQKLLASSAPSFKQSAEQMRQKIHIDGAGWHAGNGEETYPYLTAVQEAVWGECKLFIRYPRGEELVERIVCPLGLVAKRSVWYVVADVEEQLRTYRVSRLAYAEVLPERFSRPESFQLAEYWESSTAAFKQTLPRYETSLLLNAPLLGRMEHDRYVRVREWTAADKEGWLQASVEFHTLTHACETLLSYGAAVEVLGPLELRQAVISTTRAIADLYGEE